MSILVGAVTLLLLVLLVVFGFLCGYTFARKYAQTKVQGE